MKTLFYKFLILTFLIPVVVLGNTGDEKHKGKHTKKKTIVKEFSVEADALLKISNSYGTVHMTAWDKNMVVIEVLIETNGDDESKVTERLEEIDIDFSNSSTMVSANTDLQSNKSKSWWKWNKRNNVSTTVNYTIKFPKGNELNISNDYGGIFLNKAENKVTLNCDYGRMEIGELLGNDNTLNFDYTNNVTIAYMKNGRINADYSSFKVNKAGAIRLYTEHTKSQFGTVDSVEYNCDYHTLQIEQANTVTGTGEYLSLRLGTITGNLDLKSDYGSIKIGEMTANAGSIRIVSEYAGIKIGYNSQYRFSFELSLEYASLKGDDDFVMNKKRVESIDRYYQGYHGNATSGHTIRINSEYGSIRFEKQ